MHFLVTLTSSSVEASILTTLLVDRSKKKKKYQEIWGRLQLKKTKQQTSMKSLTWMTTGDDLCGNTAIERNHCFKGCFKEKYMFVLYAKKDKTHAGIRTRNPLIRSQKR